MEPTPRRWDRAGEPVSRKEDLVPQLSKGGKFVFGRSVLREDLSVRFPPQAVREYAITAERRVYLMTGSRSTGGFCVSRRGLLAPSKLGMILADNPRLLEYQTAPGEFVRYKGRSYCWLPIGDEGVLRFAAPMLDLLELRVGMQLLAIRSSDLAFTMGAKGRLLEAADAYQGVIEEF